MTIKYLAITGAAMIFLSCGSNNIGTVQVFVEPEGTITHGLQAGDGDEDIKDGWNVTYTKFITVIGNFRAWRSSQPGSVLRDPTIYVVDLQQTPAGGLILATFNDVDAERWDKFGYDIPNASATAIRAQGTSLEDFNRMIDGGYSLHVAGIMTKGLETIQFDWMLKAGTSFDDCAPADGDAGFAVPSGGTVAIKPTIHGDHWFFTNVTHGEEITERRAQWIADADLDHNATTTLDELGQAQASNLFPAQFYSLPENTLTGLGYLNHQARTLGDFDGEGECPTRKEIP